MKFEIKTDLTLQDFESYYRLNKKVHAPTAYLLGRIGLVAAIILAVGMVINIVVNRLWSDKGIMVPTCIFVVLLIALPFVNRWMISRFYKANRELLKGVYSTEESGIRVGGERPDKIFTWSAFCELYHGNDTYYLYTDKVHALILPERSFTQGDPAAFGSFVAGKTGLELKEIK